MKVPLTNTGKVLMVSERLLSTLTRARVQGHMRQTDPATMRNEQRWRWRIRQSLHRLSTDLNLRAGMARTTVLRHLQETQRI